MKRKIAFTCLLTLTLVTFNVFAQNVSTDPDSDKFVSSRKITEVKAAEDTYTGSPYESETFQNGNVYMGQQIVATNVALRYNALRDEIEYKESLSAPDNTARLLIQSPDIYIKIYNKMFEYVPSNTPDKKGGYYQVLEEGETVDLYKKITVEYIEGMKAINSIAKDILPMYKMDEELYLVTKQGEFKELPRSRNGKIKLFGDHKKEVKKYIRDNDLNINKDYDLLKLVEYYNTL